MEICTFRERFEFGLISYYPIGTLPERLHSTITSYAKTTWKHTNPKETRFLPSLTLVTLLANHPLPLLTPSLGASPLPTRSSHSKFWRYRSRLCSCAALYFVCSLYPGLLLLRLLAGVVEVLHPVSGCSSWGVVCLVCRWGHPAAFFHYLSVGVLLA